MPKALALEFRPKSFDEFVGQKDIVSVFKSFVSNKKIPHSIFFGQAGSGKTSLARIIANELNYDFYEFDGGNFKADDIRKIINSYKGGLLKPLIFIDEIHRLSKNQQEILLIPMENYSAIIMGATTENPKFSLTSGIRSRTMIFEFKALEFDDLNSLLESLKNKIDFKIDENAKDYLISCSGGDARAMTNLLEFALSVDKNITIKTLKILKSNKVSEGVSSKDSHYEIISAFIKSLRGSDTNAAIYYLARLINAGESAEFIARRLVIFASEDIGNANPNALNLAINTLNAVSKIGYPEARIILSQCAVYLSCSPKSNSSYKAINLALDYVENNEILEIPKYLINTNEEKKDYLYPHDFGGWVDQKYLSKDLKFYKSKNIGFEKTLNEWICKIKSKSNN